MNVVSQKNTDSLFEQNREKVDAKKMEPCKTPSKLGNCIPTVLQKKAEQLYMFTTGSNSVL